MTRSARSISVRQHTGHLWSSCGITRQSRSRHAFCDACKRSRAHLPASAWPQAASRHGQWQGGVECHLVAGPRRAPSVSIALHWFSRRHSRARKRQLEDVLGPLAASSASIAQLPRSWLVLTLGGAPSGGGVEARPRHQLDDAVRWQPRLAPAARTRARASQQSRLRLVGSSG